MKYIEGVEDVEDGEDRDEEGRIKRTGDWKSRKPVGSSARPRHKDTLHAADTRILLF